jgi:hypothetical protein
MTSTQPKEVILKTDTRGRVFTPVARREKLLDEFEQSGLSGAKFAQLTGLKYSTFAIWAQRRRRQRGTTVPPSQKVPSPPAQWLEAVVEQAAQREGSPPVRVRLASGAWVELEHAGQTALVAALLRAWEKAAPAC